MKNVMLVPKERIPTVMEIGPRLDEIPARRPGSLRHGRPGSAPRVLETLEGLVESMGDRADVILYEDGQAVAYRMSAELLRAKGIEEGDSFWFDVIEHGGSVTGRIRARPAEPEPESPPTYMTPDELDSIADPWP